MSLRVVFAGTPAFAVPTLQTLLDSKHEVVAVYTQPDRPSGRGQQVHRTPVKVLSEQHNIPVHQPKSWKTTEVEEQLNAYRPDVIVVVAYGMMVPPSILDLPKYGCINVHASLLPRWRGAAPIQYAIISADESTGVTIMQMTRGLDQGAILATAKLALNFDETFAKLHDQLSTLGGPALLDVLAECEAGTLKPQEQDDSLSTYAHKITKADANIDWSMSAVHIERLVRAYDPWPVAFTHVGEQVMKIWRAQVLEQASGDAQIGSIKAVSDQGLDIATGQGVLRLLEVQFAGGKRLPIADVLHSKRDWFEPGALLCS